MMTGTKRPSLADAEKAATMVAGPDVLFAGILERWNDTIVLFHCIFMPGEQPLQAELSNLHPTIRSSVASTPPDDPFDEIVYAAALQRFEKDAALHSKCLKESSEKWGIVTSVSAGA
jgi:hypothetical protein